MRRERNADDPTRQKSAHFWRTAMPVFNDKREVLKGGMFPAQRAWWNSTAFIKLFIGGYGCIHGGASVDVRIGESESQMRLSDLVWMFSAFPNTTFHVKRKTADGTVNYGVLNKAWYSGAKTTRRIVIGDAVTRATDTHPFWTPDGWKKLRDLSVGDYGTVELDGKAQFRRINFIGDEHAENTYDLQLADEPHNFVADGIVLKNSGKTNVQCKRAIALAMHNAPAPYAIVSPSYGVAKETTVLTCRELLEGKALIRPNFRWDEWKRTPHEFHVRENGRHGRILIYSGEDPDKLKGPNLGAAGMDEPFIQQKAVFDQMVARIRHPKSRVREMNLTGTPEMNAWARQLAEGKLGKGLDMDTFRASTKENIALPADYVTRLLAQYDEKTAQAYLDGLFVNLNEGIIFHAFDYNSNVVDMIAPQHAHWGVGMDFNVDPMSATIFWSTHDHIHFVGEITLRNSDTVKMCQQIRARYPQVNDVYPDSNAGRSTNSPGGKTDYDYIREQGFTPHILMEGNPRLADRYNAVNGMLRPAQGPLRCTISAACEELIANLGQYTHDNCGTKIGKKYGHILDAFSYPIWHLFPLYKPSATTLHLQGF